MTAVHGAHEPVADRVRAARGDARPASIADAGLTAPAILAEGRRRARAILAAGSKSFALAGLLLGARARDDAAVLYAFCRRADDRIDDGPDEPRARAAALASLRAELDAIYRGDVDDPLLVALHELVTRRRLPRAYPEALLDGFAMDASGARYATLAELERYAFRVAGVVGLMMCHVLGVRDEACLPRAAHLGIAMQLTNVCRDVLEDWQRGRLYLPAGLLGGGAAGTLASGAPALPADPQLRRAVAALLARADRYYRSGLRGLQALDGRSALAIATAARVYRAIGVRIRRRGHDVRAGRAIVPGPLKLAIALRCIAGALVRAPRRWLDRLRSGAVALHPPRTTLSETDAVLPF